MGKTEKLKPRQLAVIDELFNGDDEQAVLDKHKVSRKLYNKWLADETFTGEFDRRIDTAYRQSAVLIARYAPLAAAKLVQLTESDKEEVVRKVCLDIISMLDMQCHVERSETSGYRGKYRPQIDSSAAPQNDPDLLSSPLSTEAASRLLAALAQSEQ